jgi:hypothetical protein
MTNKQIIIQMFLDNALHTKDHLPPLIPSLFRALVYLYMYVSPYLFTAFNPPVTYFKSNLIEANNMLYSSSKDILHY